MLRFSFLTAAIAAISLAAGAQEPKKTPINGGVEGKIKSVDVEKDTVTISTEGGKARTYNVSNETAIIGPRGGIVRRRLRDPRFQEGFVITVVATGDQAKELHLGFAHAEHQDAGKSTDHPTKKGADRNPDAKSDDTPTTKKADPKKSDSKKPDMKASSKTSPADVHADAKTATKTETKTAHAPNNEDEDDDYPGKVKSYDSAKRFLVVTLLNGKDQSFLVASSVKVTVHGAASKQGIKDPAIKVGAPITVVTEPGSKKVKELELTTPAPTSKGSTTPAKGKKAG
jgi:hypothetical protein